MTIINLTSPGKTPVKGDWLEETYGSGRKFNYIYDPDMPWSEEDARNWRDVELDSTDWILPVTDHPQHAAYKTYRTKLRDWPGTSDFPDTKPTL